MTLFQKPRLADPGLLAIGVVGAGAMGSGIAQVAAAAGHRVILGDANPAAVAKAMAGIGKSLARDVDKGRIEPSTADAIASPARASAYCASLRRALSNACTAERAPSGVYSTRAARPRRYSR